MLYVMLGHLIRELNRDWTPLKDNATARQLSSGIYSLIPETKLPYRTSTH